MRQKSKLFSLLALAMLFSLAACGGGGGDTSVKDDGVIRLWVGEESAEFYQKLCNQYVADHAF